MGQTPEELLEAGDYPAAAEAFTTKGSRADMLAAGNAWSAVDSFTLARAAFLRVIIPDDGKPVIDSLSGLAQHKIGVSYYNQYNDAAAAAAYRKAISIRDQFFPRAHKDQAHSRRNLANCLSYLGQTDTASLLLREAIAIYSSVQSTDSVNWLRSLNDLSKISEEVRDYQTGVSASRRAIGLLQDMPNADVYDAYDTYYYAGSTNYTFREIPAANRAANRALPLAESIGDPLLIGRSLNLLGAISDVEGNAKKKIDYWERAISFLTEQNVGKVDVGLLHFNLARARGAAGESAAAFRDAARARELLSEEAPDYLPRLASVEGSIHRRRGDEAAALKAFDEGLRLLAPYATAGLAYPLPDSLSAAELETAADLLGDRAEMLSALGRPEAALEDYTLLFALQDQLRTRVSADESRRYLSQNLRKYFDRAVSLLYQQHQAAPNAGYHWKAFELSERARAYTLLANLQQDRAAMPRQEAELRARVAELERSDKTELLAAARLQLDRLVQAGRSDISTPDFKFDRSAITALLSKTQTDLLVFHLSEKDGYRFYVSPEGHLNFQKLEEVTTLTERISRWRAAIQDGAYRRKSLRAVAEQQTLDETFLNEGNLLTKQLFPQAEQYSFGKDLCIIPDGPLTLLPFAALPLGPGEHPLNYASLRYLQTDHRVRYAYSASVLLELANQDAQEYTHNLIAFAPSFGGKTSVQAVSRSVSLATRLGERALAGLQPLRFNRAEVEDIESIVPGALVYFDEEANRGRFLEGISESRILHLSTHGMVNAADPRLSFVAFTQRGDSLELEELLYYNDLAALPLRTELAVLSACETSLGSYIPGETTLSLATAFTAAGARSTLTTLWQVDDAATRDLMVAFYRNLTAGNSRAESLAAAQLMQLEGGEFAHPYFWSAMTLYGEAGPIAFDADLFNPYYLWGALTGFLLLGVYTIYWNGRKKGADAGAG